MDWCVKVHIVCSLAACRVTDSSGVSCLTSFSGELQFARRLAPIQLVFLLLANEASLVFKKINKNLCKIAKLKINITVIKMTGVAKLLTELRRVVFILPAAVRFSGRSMGFPQLPPCGRGRGVSTGCLVERTAGAAAGLMSRTPLAAPACLCSVNTNVLDRGCKSVGCYFGKKERKKHGYIENWASLLLIKHANQLKNILRHLSHIFCTDISYSFVGSGMFLLEADRSDLLSQLLTGLLLLPLPILLVVVVVLLLLLCGSSGSMYAFLMASSNHLVKTVKIYLKFTKRTTVLK